METKTKKSAPFSGNGFRYHSMLRLRSAQGSVYRWLKASRQNHTLISTSTPEGSSSFISASTVLEEEE